MVIPHAGRLRRRLPWRGRFGLAGAIGGSGSIGTRLFDALCLLAFALRLSERSLAQTALHDRAEPTDPADQSGQSSQARGTSAQGESATFSDFDTFFQRFERDVYGYLWRITGDRETASDLSQETFLRAWQHFATVQGYERPQGWLFRVATNLAINARRRRLTRVGEPVRLNDEDQAFAQSDPGLRIAERDATHRALLDLAPKMRAALVLREVYGLSVAEVAQALGISLAAAKMTLSRGREQFRQQYTQQEARDAR